MKKKLFQVSFWAPGILCGLILGFWLTGCSSQNDASPVYSAAQGPGTPRSFSTTWDDSIIYTRIKRKMLSDDLVNAAPIDVNVYNGVAYLTGTVETDSEKRMAADLVRGVEGVVKVENQLAVK